MEDQYTNYKEWVQIQVSEKEKKDFLILARPIVSEIKLLAENNSDTISTFEEVHRELTSLFNSSQNDVSQLTTFLSDLENGLNDLLGLNTEIDKVKSHKMSSELSFSSKVSDLLNRAYTKMKISEIHSVKKSISDLIADMDRYELEMENAKEERRKQIIRYVLIGIGVLFCLYIIVAFIVPFIIEWWWAILLVFIVLGWIVSKIFK